MMREPAAVLDSMKDKLSLEDLEILIAYFAQQGRDMWQALEVYDWMVRGNRVERRTRRLIHVIMDQRLGQLLQEGCPTEKVVRLVGRMVDLGLPPDFPLKRLVGEELWDRGAVAEVVKLLRMFRDEEERVGMGAAESRRQDNRLPGVERSGVRSEQQQSSREASTGGVIEAKRGQDQEGRQAGIESKSREVEADREGDGAVVVREAGAAAEAVAEAVGDEEAMRAAEEREDLVGLLLLRAVSAGQYRQVLPLPRMLREAGVEVGVAGFSAVLASAVKEQEKLSVARRELRDLQQMGLVGQLSPLDGLLLEVHGATLRHEAEQVVQWCAEECEGDLQRLRAAVGERERQREKRLAELREGGRGGYEVKGREAQLYQQVAEDGEGRLILRRDAQITGLSRGLLSGGSMREEEEEGYRIGSQERDESWLLLDLQRNRRGEVEWGGESDVQRGTQSFIQRLEALGCPLDEWAYALMVGGALKGGHVDVAAYAVRELVVLCSHGVAGGAVLSWCSWWCCALMLVVLCSHGVAGGAVLSWCSWWCCALMLVVLCSHGVAGGAVLSWCSWCIEWAYALMVVGALKGGHVDVAALAIALVLVVEAYLGLCAALADVGLLEPTIVFLYVDPHLPSPLPPPCPQMVRRGMQPNAQQLALVLRRLQRGDAGVEAYLGLCAALADVGLLEPTLVFLYVDLLRLCILRML
ncbi:unnamed protein product [Closterium sp. Yama58-4]|nr:unnamed protein product [Closterium sp. Yama58-4]